MNEGIVRQSLVYKKLIVWLWEQQKYLSYLCFNAMSFILVRHTGSTGAEMSTLTLGRNDKAANSGRFLGGGKEKR